MSFTQSGSTLTFSANGLGGSQPVMFPDRGQTRLDQLTDGTVAFSWHTTLPGIVELFNPATGAETATNVILGELHSRFGGMFYEAVDFAGVAALSNGNFVAAYQADVPNGNLFDSRTYYQIYTKTGAEVGSLIEFDDAASLTYQDEPAIHSTPNGFLFTHEVSHNDFELRFYTNAGTQVGTSVTLNDLEFIQAQTLSNGQTLVLTKSEFAVPNSEDNWQLRFYNPVTGAQVGTTQTFTVTPSAGASVRNMIVHDVAEIPGGGYAVIWQESPDFRLNKFYVELFNNDGSTHRSVFSPREIDMNGAPIHTISDVKVIPLQGGGYVVVWVADDATSENDVWGVIFDENEAQVGPITRLSEDLLGDQESLDAILLDDGRLAISYTDDDNVGRGNAIVQIFDVSTAEAVTLGTENRDVITGTPGRDVYDLLGGNDVFDGLGGHDVVKGGSGRDKLIGRAGNDELLGEGGADKLFGGSGRDHLTGGKGGDILNGGSGRDQADYGTATSGVRADLQNAATNTGDATGDSFFSIEDLGGSAFRDILNGDSGNNKIFGQGGRDVLRGRDGDDDLVGGAGRDLLIGGAGNDKLNGGNGIDTFVFDEGHDVIRSFSNDRLKLDDALWNNASLTKAQVLAMATVSGGDTVFDFGGGNTLTIRDYTDIAGLDPLLEIF